MCKLQEEVAPSLGSSRLVLCAALGVGGRTETLDASASAAATAAPSICSVGAAAHGGKQGYSCVCDTFWIFAVHLDSEHIERRVPIRVLLHHLGARHSEVLLRYVDPPLTQREHASLCAHRLGEETGGWSRVGRVLR